MSPSNIDCPDRRMKNSGCYYVPWYAHPLVRGALLTLTTIPSMNIVAVITETDIITINCCKPVEQIKIIYN